MTLRAPKRAQLPGARSEAPLQSLLLLCPLQRMVPRAAQIDLRKKLAALTRRKPDLQMLEVDLRLEV